MYNCRCRHCKATFESNIDSSRLCNECMFMYRTYEEYDSLREEGYPMYQAQVMSGLADPYYEEK